MNDRDDRHEGASARAAREAELWRQIVENFGERAHLEDEPVDQVAEAPLETPDDLPEETEGEESPWATRRGHLATDPAEERFVPPEPGPAPLPEPGRLLAWLGVLGVPVLLIVLTIVQWSPPSWVALLMLVWFLGGFGFLVSTMRRSDDNGDDGARV